MDYWDLSGKYGSLEAAFAQSEANFLVLSFESDWLYPTRDSLDIARALTLAGRPVEHIELFSTAGHDAFLVDYKEQIPIIQNFLDRSQ
jgi:homoserine O-acetyltransferase